jgi:Derlin-2/3
MVYVWARRNPYVRMSFLGLFSFNAPYLPWVLLSFAVVLGNSATIDLIGIIVGHVYYFLEDVYPLIADIRGWQVRRWLAAPVLLKQLFGEHIPAPMRGGVHAPPVMDDAGVGADVDGVGADVDGAGVDAAAGGANAQQNDPAGVPGREEEQGPAAVAAH